MAAADRVERPEAGLDVGLDVGPDVGLDVDLELVRDLAAGRIGPAEARRRDGPGHGPTVDALIDGELATRRGESTVAELVDLAAGVERRAAQVPAVPAARAVRWWARALVAERCGLDLDMAGARRAVAVLKEVPDDPLVPVVVLWVRGRLRRAAGLLELFGAPPDRARSRHLRGQAIADFARGGFPEEVAVTRLLGATGEALWLYEDVERNLAAALDAREAVAPDSAWSPLVDALVSIAAVSAGDRAVANRFLAAPKAPRLPSALAIAGPVLRALHDVEHRSGSPAATAAAVSAAVGLPGADPLSGHRLQLVAAGALLDLGHGPIARELALPVLDLPPIDQVDVLERDVLALRLRLHAGEDVPVAALNAVLDRFEAIGHARRMGAAAQRLAGDLARVGRGPDVAALSGRPPAPLASGPADVPSGDVPSAVSVAAVPMRMPVRVRVMAPTVTVEVRGQRQELRTTAARLLLALVLAHLAPLAAEAAADALWPAVAWDGERRRRLNTVVHRLRRGLGDAGAAVGRVGDALTLTPDGWDVDLFRLRRALERNPAGAAEGPGVVEALTGVSGNLAHVQFPYDDQLVDERQGLLAAISRRLGADDGRSAHSRHAEVLRALGLPPA